MYLLICAKNTGVHVDIVKEVNVTEEDKCYMDHIKNRAATLSRFNLHRDDMTKLLPEGWSIYELQRMITSTFGYFNLKSTYCGPGTLGDKIIPDFQFKFAGYVHDAIYHLIEVERLSYLIWKPIADKMFLEIMLNKCDSFIWRGVAYGYYYSVVAFGNPKPKEA